MAKPPSTTVQQSQEVAADPGNPYPRPRCRNAGALPPDFSSLSKMQELSLANNTFNGPLPTAYSTMTALTRLNLVNNAM